MRKNLLRQLEKLEAECSEIRPVDILWVDQISIEQQNMLTVNDRVVEDWYLGSGDRILSIKQRVTADPSDVGLNYVGTSRQLNDFTLDESKIERKEMRRGRRCLNCIVRDSEAPRIEPKPGSSRYSSVILTLDQTLPTELSGDEFDAA